MRLYFSYLLVIFSLLASFGVQGAFSVQEEESSSSQSTYSPWSFSAFSLLSTEWDENSQGGEMLSSYNYLSANYRIWGGRKLALRLPFTYSSAGYDSFNGDQHQESEFLLQNPFLSYVIYDLMLLPLDIGVFWEGRVYLPLSQYSREIGLITRLRNDIIFSKLLSRNWEVEYVNKLNYYAQSKSIVGRIAMDKETGQKRVYIGNTKQWTMDHWLSTWYKFNPKTGFGFRLGGKDTWYNNTGALNRGVKREFRLGPQFRFALAERANFIFSVERTMGYDNFNELSFRNLRGAGRNNGLNWLLLSFLRF